MSFCKAGQMKNFDHRSCAELHCVILLSSSSLCTESDALADNAVCRFRTKQKTFFLGFAQRKPLRVTLIKWRCAHSIMAPKNQWKPCKLPTSSLHRMTKLGGSFASCVTWLNWPHFSEHWKLIISHENSWWGSIFLIAKTSSIFLQPFSFSTYLVYT